MPEDRAAPPPSPPRTWLRALAVVFVAGAAFVGSGLTTCAFQSWRAANDPQPTTVLRGTSTVVSAMRDLATLESASYHVERVIDLRDRQSHLFGLVESEDAVLLVAAADIVAGVDLTTMRDGDVSISPKERSARIVLPPATVLSARLDNQRTYVHSRNTDALALRAESLETRARQEAERTLREAAIEAGILQRARTNASRTLEVLVRSLGFERVQIEFRPE